MKIQDQTVVTMTYILRENDENGRLIQEATKDNPFTFICGMHRVLPKFEENLMGKEPGDHYCFYLTPAEGYGEHDEKLVVDIDKNFFIQNDVLENMLKVDARFVIPTNLGPMAGVVKEINEQTVKMDFNSDLVGKHLCFSGEILDVREATDEDFKEESCGGDCEGCSGCH